MSSWKVSLRVPVKVDVVVYADTEDEAADLAIGEADLGEAKDDGVWEIVEVEEA